MKTKEHSKLWLYFASIVFLIMFMSAFIMTIITFSLFRHGLFRFAGHNPTMLIISLLFISVVVGTCISLIIGKKIIKPITEFSIASKEVAKGNFNITLSETGRISEIKELTRNFNRMVQELSSTETLRNDFIVNVSHEFKTPISAIEGYATLLQDRTLTDEERDEYTNLIIDSSKQLATLTGNILKLSKLESQEAILETREFRLDEQLRQVVLLLEAEWSIKNLQLEIEMPKVCYRGDEKLIMQVWLNLIGNAIKFTPKDGTIGLKLILDNEDAVVTISDTGCGMDENVQRHMFDKFYQGDTARKSEGNGLGLALVKRIIYLCYGSITVNSEVNKGTSITVRLPLNGK